MAVCPFAVKKLIAPGSSDPRIEPRLAILHSDGMNAESLFNWFNGPSGGVESHFHVTKTGRLEQYRDTDYEADANYLANPFAVSIETQGTGYEDWTAAQLAMIIKLLLWLHEVHPSITLEKPATWDGSGVGYHIQFGSPGKWTNTSKICPGPTRIKQYESVILPELAKASETGNDVAAEDVWNHKLGVIGTETQIQAGLMLRQTHNRAGAARTAAQTAMNAVSDLALLIKSMPGTTPDLTALADQIVARVSSEVAQLSAEAVAEQLEITVKDPSAGDN